MSTLTSTTHSSDDLRGVCITIMCANGDEEEVIVTRIVNSTTCVVARPTWWRRAYWAVRRAAKRKIGKKP